VAARRRPRPARPAAAHRPGRRRAALGRAVDLGGGRRPARRVLGGEGCSNEEIKELWNSFQQECFVERCWTEEVFELSGGVRRHDMPYYSDTRVDAMFEAFRSRLGKQFQDPAMKQGPTDDAWNWLVQKLDGRVIKTPRSSCDPYCG
jgi:hypothetical protein